MQVAVDLSQLMTIKVMVSFLYYFFSFQENRCEPSCPKLLTTGSVYLRINYRYRVISLSAFYCSFKHAQSADQKTVDVYHGQHTMQVRPTIRGRLNCKLVKRDNRAKFYLKICNLFIVHCAFEFTENDT